MVRPSTWLRNAADSIFSKDSVIDKAADGVYNGIDKSWFTEEEQSEAYRELLALWLRMIEGTQAWNVARREIAFKIIDLWVFYVLLTTLVVVLDIQHSDKVVQILLDVVQPTGAIVVGFYFLKRFLPGSDLVKLGAERARTMINKVKGANSNGS